MAVRYHHGAPTMKPLVIAGVLLALAGVTLSSQVRTVPSPGQRPTLMSIVSGQVVDDSGRLIEKATVRLVSAGAIATRLTDRRGRFLYENVPAGAYVLTVSKSGYYDGAFGKRRPAGTPLPFEIAATQSLSDVRVELFRGSVITGSVVDEGSEPVAGVRVIAFRRDFVEGEWRYTTSGSGVTDDRGAFRVFGLEPGEYVVSTPTTQANTSDGEVLTATLSDIDARATAYPSVFYPAARYFPLALPLLLASGEVKYAVDFKWSPVVARTVSGRLTGSESAIANQVVRLVPFDSMGAGFGTEAAITLSAPDGSFTFLRVPAGDYRLEAGAAFTGQTEETVAVTWGRADVAVIDEDVTKLEVAMGGGRSIAGAVIFAASARSSGAVARVPLTLVPAAPGLSPTSKIVIDADGTFTRTNLVPGPYYIRVGATPPGTYVQSIFGGGHDALDAPVDLTDSDLDDIEVTLTDRGTELIGTVRDGRLLQIPGAAVIVMSAHERRWTPNRTRYLRASTAGSFAITGLPPGEYLIVAVDDALAEGWQDLRGTDAAENARHPNRAPRSGKSDIGAAPERTSTVKPCHRFFTRPRPDRRL